MSLVTLILNTVVAVRLRGSQDCSENYQALLKHHNLRGSMSAKGCCYDIASAESVFHALKVGCIHITWVDSKLRCPLKACSTHNR